MAGVGGPSRQCSVTSEGGVGEELELLGNIYLDELLVESREGYVFSRDIL